APYDGQISQALLQAALDQKTQQPLSKIHDVVKFAVGDFGLDHPKFSEVTAGLGCLRTEGGAEGIHLAQRRCGGFDIELTGLSEKGFFLEIIYRKQRAG